MTFIDSHCHLDFALLSTDIQSVLNKATLAGVNEFVVPSVTRNNFQSVLALSHHYPNIHAALGMHPCFMSSHCLADLIILRDAIEAHRPCAVGEIGLDYFITKDKVLQAEQLALFKAQLLIAKEAALPVILHVRKAHDQVLKSLRDISFDQGGIVHAFNGSKEQAQRYCREFNFKLGFGGAITHQRATKLRLLATNLPLTDIVLETDAPDMPLADMPGAFNQPANVALIAAVIFELRKESADTIQQQIMLNTQQVLRLDQNKG